MKEAKNFISQQFQIKFISFGKKIYKRERENEKKRRATAFIQFEICMFDKGPEPKEPKHDVVRVCKMACKHWDMKHSDKSMWCVLSNYVLRCCTCASAAAAVAVAVAVDVVVVAAFHWSQPSSVVFFCFYISLNELVFSLLVHGSECEMKTLHRPQTEYIRKPKYIDFIYFCKE